MATVQWVEYQTWNHLAWRSAANALRHFCLSSRSAAFTTAVVFVCSTEHCNHYDESIGWVFDQSGEPRWDQQEVSRGPTYALTKATKLHAVGTAVYQCTTRPKPLDQKSFHSFGLQHTGPFRRHIIDREQPQTWSVQYNDGRIHVQHINGKRLWYKFWLSVKWINHKY